MPPSQPPRGRGDWLTVQDDPAPKPQDPPHGPSLPCFRHSPGAGRPPYRNAAGAPDGLRTLEWQWGQGQRQVAAPPHSVSAPVHGNSQFPTLHTPLSCRTAPLTVPPSPAPPPAAPPLPYPCGCQRPPAPAVPSATGYVELRPGTAGPLLGVQAGVPASRPGSRGYRGWGVGGEPI